MKRSVSAAVVGVALAALIGVGVAAASDGTGPAGRLADVLSGLVSKGTITQQQADAVDEALTDSWQQERTEREADRVARKAEIDAVLKDTLGMDADAVREQIQGGKTLREVAGELRRRTGGRDARPGRHTAGRGSQGRPDHPGPGRGDPEPGQGPR